MIICTNCFHEVPDELTSCPFCGADVEPDGVVPVSEDTPWEVLRTFSREIEAQIVAGRLLAHGIPACVLSQVDSTRNFTIGALAVVKLFVPVDARNAAEAVLRHSDELDADTEFEEG